VAFRNRGDLTFEDASTTWNFDAEGVSHGMCLADFDNDGDLDVVVNNLNDMAGVYRNEGTAPRVAVRLKGQAPNSRGIGAKIWLYGGAVPVQIQEMICGGRYLSSDDPMRVFAAGSPTSEMRIEVKWRSGKRSLVSEVKANRLYEIQEPEKGDSGRNEPGSEERSTSSIAAPASESAPSLFDDVSGLIGHIHPEEEFNDFERQAMLPRKLSQLGPGVGWIDVDGDGWEDLVIGSGRGGRPGVYRNNRQGGFERVTTAPFEKLVTRDQAGVVGWNRAPGSTAILIGSANYEDGLTQGTSVRQYDLAGGSPD
jgi:hypothetical protein